MAKASAGRSALSRTMQLLAAFDVDAVFLSISQLSRRSGMPLATTHRLVAELEEFGLLERQPDKTYRLGVRLWELACRTPGALGLREIAMVHLQAVQSRVRQHTQLGILEGNEVLFLERLSARDAVVNVTLVGGRLPLHASSSGLVLLAHAPEAYQEDIVRKELFQYTDHTIRDPEDLRRTLHEIRRSGHVVASGYIHPDARGIAVPVFGVNDAVVAGVSVVVPNDDAPVLPLVGLLKAASRAITKDLLAAYAPTGSAAAGSRYRTLVGSSVDSLEYLPSAPRPDRTPAGPGLRRDGTKG
ncbi:IclR family transcriptional regulator [Arthrobacter crystallopoietes BAB-32]|uniref:IclR family transcriptional regulator n=1 Tax=Arthrobacter crystallopoietes BAB-32 TaxID=1246476 RepID=N1UW30_9MICC|nr:IclR family transcriptional regulator [Arthrobacter crystallopoietes]EMY34611.1 IclR family transcriptional regulator [Arthrobacter crystallopoietes BAB-32]